MENTLEQMTKRIKAINFLNTQGPMYEKHPLRAAQDIIEAFQDFGWLIVPFLPKFMQDTIEIIYGNSIPDQQAQ